MGGLESPQAPTQVHPSTATTIRRSPPARTTRAGGYLKSCPRGRVSAFLLVQGRNMYQTPLDFNLDDATDYAAPNAQSVTFPTTRPDPEKTLTRLRTRLARSPSQWQWCPVRAVCRVARSTPRPMPQARR